jgi:hypothetical protein
MFGLVPAATQGLSALRCAPLISDQRAPGCRDRTLLQAETTNSGTDGGRRRIRASPVCRVGPRPQWRRDGVAELWDGMAITPGGND